jgi:Ca-activated chloride channel family protein
MSEFHFLRPLWLVALPLGVWLIWRLLGQSGTRGNWVAVVDPRLQPYVLMRPDAFGASRWPLLAALTAWSVAALALAGPTWERMPVPAFRSDDALVVALDLSRSMDAGDLEPSRLTRAKLKLLGLLERRGGGQTALVVFSAHAFTVTPLTTDTRTIAALINALHSDIMPSRGSYPEAGLQRAGTLLQQAGMTRGEILLITDADVSPQSLDVVRELGRSGYTVSVLAAGTAEGAPIPEAGGGFLTDRSGRVVVPQLDVAGLRRLADAGGGRFAQLSPGDRDLEALFPERGPDVGAVAAGGEQQDYEADVWRDEGVWLAVLLLPFAALGFRRGWVAAWLVCLLLPAPRAAAFEWRDLWKRADQQGYEAMQAEQPEVAAELFEDPQWRAAAEYRIGDYAGSVAALQPLDTVTAHYNRGNALARAGQLEPAIEAYDRALDLDPQHADAIYNRALLEELLEQQRQNEEQQNQQSGANDDDQSAENSGDSGEQPEDGESESSRSEGENDQAERNAQQQSGQGDQRQDDGTQSPDDGDPSEQQADNEPEPREGEGEPSEQQAAVGPEDIEQWASDQAAEQWLRRIAQDPGGLLRRKFLYQYQRLGVDQDGNYVWPGDEAEPW